MIENGVAEIRRVAYDIDATAVGIRDMGLPDDLGALLVAILKTGTPLDGPALQDVTIRLA